MPQILRNLQDLDESKGKIGITSERMPILNNVVRFASQGTPFSDLRKPLDRRRNSGSFSELADWLSADLSGPDLQRIRRTATCDQAHPLESANQAAPEAIRPRAVDPIAVFPGSIP